jgi:hypothetical protein
MMLLCRCLRNRQKKNLHLLPHQRIIENKSRSMNMSLAEEDESNIFLEKLESCNNTFTNLLSRNFCDDGSNDDRLLAKKHKINNETFQNSYYQSSRTNPTTSQLSTTNAQPRKRADTLGSASLTVAAALNINLSSLGPLYSSSPAVRKESSSSSSNRVSRAPSPAPENNRFTTTTKKLK